MTAPTEHELVAGLKKVRYDLTDLQGKVSELLRLAAKLELPAAQPSVPPCPECGTGGGYHAADCIALQGAIEERNAA